MRKLQKALHKKVRHLFHPQRSNNHRSRVLHPKPILMLAGLLAAVGTLIHYGGMALPDAGSILGFSSTITTYNVIDQTNIERAKHGVPPLVENPLLSQAAKAKAIDMFTDQYWSHVAPDGTEPWSFVAASGYQYSIAGENLARDFATTPEMVAAWMDSPTHRANILHGRYSEIGIAVVDGELEGYETTLVVQMFGSPTGSSQAITLDPPTLPNSGQLGASGQSAGQPQVLADSFLSIPELRRPPLFTPLQLIKAVSLSVIMLISATLTYDAVVAHHLMRVRLVSKNLAHIFFMGAVLFLVLFFKGGIIG